jgi:hypothetical protein
MRIPFIRLILDGGIDAKRDGDSWLIEKLSLYEFQEALALVLHWLVSER